MCVNSEAAAVRIFTNEVNRYDPNNLLSTNKTDFSLYVVGEFDLSSGCVVNRDPRVLIHGSDILEDVKFSRYTRALLNVEDSFPERLAVREEVTKARISSLSRKL